LSGPADDTFVVCVAVSVAHNFVRITEGGVGYGATSTSLVEPKKCSFCILGMGLVVHLGTHC